MSQLNRAVYSPRLMKNSMDLHRSKILLLLFFVSGFCSLLYQTVWLRLALAFFGVITPVVSVVVSVFMLGFCLGSWAGGKLIGYLRSKTGFSAITFYGLTELVIALGAFVVPIGFAIGKSVLLDAGESNSVQYLICSAIVIAASILIWSTAMGATFPFVMAFLEEFDDSDKRSFSFLYMANVAGAVLGTLSTVLILVELLGFHHTLTVAAVLNLLIGLTAVFWGVKRGKKSQWVQTTRATALTVSRNNQNIFICAILFTTGLISMAMEIVWTRADTNILGTVVYSFAQLLATYLAATYIGSYFYRRDCAHDRVKSKELVLAASAVTVLLPILFGGEASASALCAALHVPIEALTLFAIVPFCASLGYLTPLLLDDLSQGDPEIAGKAYALNMLGCIVGPLIAGYLLLPNVSARLSFIILSVPILLFGLAASKNLARRVQIGMIALCLFLMSVALNTGSLEEGANLKDANLLNIVVRRDNVATVISYGTGMGKGLQVNGVGITILSPITKYMAHLPLAFLKSKPESALVICFGMGTTFRSLASWGIDTTAVELSPSVVQAFVSYHDDAKDILKNPKTRVIIDDGRRFLNRTSEKYDVITIDPPPPVEAAGSSLLYSSDFYKVVRQHLKPGGVLQQWYPRNQGETLHAVARSLVKSFPYVRAYRSIEGWGYHFLASEQPIAELTTGQVIAKLPEGAKRDLIEWSGEKNSEAALKREFGAVLSHQINIADLLESDDAIEITDDHPYNEYCWFRSSYHPIPTYVNKEVEKKL